MSANSRIKKGVAEALDISARTFEYSVDLTIHDIPFRFYMKSEAVIKRLYGLYPIEWFQVKAHSKPFCVYWINNEDFGFTDAQWEDNENYECFLHSAPRRQYAIQRDFLGIEENDYAILVCSYAIGDGFFNFLRWIAPKYFIHSGKLLLHSSCVLNASREAFFSLGPSGAGKTTISTLVPRSRVLGDDMNVLKIENGKIWAQAGALGQAITNPREYSHWYPVAGMLWLEKSDAISIEDISLSDQYLKLSSAVANVFWPHLKPNEVTMIFNTIGSVLKITSIKKLKFPIDREVWPTVWSHYMLKENNHVL